MYLQLNVLHVKQNGSYMLRLCPSFLCTDVCLPALVLMVLHHHCLYQISLCACVSYNTLIPFLEGRNNCYRFNTFTDFLCPDLIDGYTGERAALEEQLHQKEQLHLSLEQELQVRLYSCRKARLTFTSRPLKAAGASQSPACK